MGMKGNYNAIAKSVHFSIVINSTSRRCLEIVIDGTGKVANLAKVLPIVDYGIVENIRIPSLTSAALYVRSHFFFELFKLTILIRSKEKIVIELLQSLNTAF